MLFVAVPFLLRPRKNRALCLVQNTLQDDRYGQGNC